ncbi:MAG: hypothetical protein QM681_10710 [Novosphingobium sp.]
MIGWTGALMTLSEQEGFLPATNRFALPAQAVKGEGERLSDDA